MPSVSWYSCKWTTTMSCLVFANRSNSWSVSQLWQEERFMWHLKKLTLSAINFFINPFCLLNTDPPGLLEDHPSGVDAECCDVRWDLKVENRSRGTLKRTHPSCQHRTSLSSSAACRLCNSRLKLCLLVLVLLHTVASLTASHNATGIGLPAITSLEETPANEEWWSCQEEVRLLGRRRGDGGDSLVMATDMEKYSHSCESSCSMCLWIFCNAFWQMENVGYFWKERPKTIR